MFFPWRQAYETTPGSSWERVRPPLTTSATVPARCDRLKYQHYVLSQSALKRPLAPLQELLAPSPVPPCVLDVGSGNGDWGRALAKVYPHARIIGLDQEEVVRFPSFQPNYQFQAGNPLAGIPFPSHHFIYVHQRFLSAGIPFHHWPERIREIARVTAGGGWVELLEGGLTFHRAGPATEQIIQWCHTIAQASGVNLSCVKDLDSLLRTVGLVKVQSEVVRLPVGQWAGRRGDLVAKALLALAASLRPWCVAQVSADFFDRVVAALPAEWKTFQSEYEVYRYSAQRPLAGE